MKYRLREKLYQIYDLLNVPSAKELLAEPIKHINIQTGELYFSQHGGYFIEDFNNYIVIKSSRNNKIYILDYKNKKILDEFIFFQRNEQGNKGNLLFDFNKCAIVAKERVTKSIINY